MDDWHPISVLLATATRALLLIPVKTDIDLICTLARDPTQLRVILTYLFQLQ